MDRTRWAPALQAAAAALLFGASAPIIKYVLGDIAAVPLAALLYLGSGAGLLIAWAVRGLFQSDGVSEARLRRADAPWVAGAIFAGGVAAPILLMFSLKATPASTASLLLNFEAAGTTILAALLFREAVGRRIWLSVAVMTLASILLSWEPGGDLRFSLGALGILAACALWGLDNNLTQNVSAKDPLMIVMLKGLGAGAFSALLALIIGQPFPAAPLVLGAMLIGFLCYGLSTVLFVRSLRGLGAARTSAIYAIAPFVGALLSLGAFGEQPGVLFLAGLPLMIVGTVLLFGEQHSHYHVHTGLAHEHRYDTDEHHPAPVDAPQAVRHEHAEVGHTHAHSPDIHHRHSHDGDVTAPGQKPD